MKTRLSGQERRQPDTFQDWTANLFGPYTLTKSLTLPRKGEKDFAVPNTTIINLGLEYTFLDGKIHDDMGIKQL